MEAYMSILELSPEESLVIANSIALDIFKSYSLENAIFITDFINAIEGGLTVLISKQGLIEATNVSYNRKDIDDTDIAARLGLLEDLLLTLS
jgi:hypothetical protein